MVMNIVWCNLYNLIKFTIPVVVGRDASTYGASGGWKALSLNSPDNMQLQLYTELGLIIDYVTLILNS